MELVLFERVTDPAGTKMGAVYLHPGPWGWGRRFCSGLALNGRHLVSAAELKEVAGTSTATTAGGGEGGTGGGDS